MDVNVLIVDDSPVFRETLSKFLNESQGVTVIGVAANTDIAKEKIISLKPDVVVLQLTASKHSSTAFLKELLPKHPVPTVVITDSADEAFDTVKAGAVDFVKMPLIRTTSSLKKFTQKLLDQIKSASGTSIKAPAPAAPVAPAAAKPAPSTEPVKPVAEAVKPKPAAEPVRANVPPASPPMSDFAARVKARTEAEAAAKAKTEQNIAEAKVKARVEAELASRPERTAAAIKPAAEPAAPSDAAARATHAASAAIQRIGGVSVFSSPKGRRHVIALGASTGGTDALQVVLQDLPLDTPGIVIVQHMPEVFTKMYADRLDRSCKMTCVEAVDGDRVEPGKVILAAGNYHLRLAKDSKGYYVTSQRGEKVSGHCPSVDVLFESVAQVAGKDAIGAIFTGMGADGARGLKKMRDAGAFTIGQDQESCVVYGMPAVAYNMGGVCQQAHLDKIAGIILENC